MYQRKSYQTVTERLREPRRFIQVLAGPRQGKTTTVRQVLDNAITAIEVKIGRHRDTLPGMEAFAKAFKPQHQFLVCGQGIPLEEFFLTPVERYLEWHPRRPPQKGGFSFFVKEHLKAAKEVRFMVVFF